MNNEMVYYWILVSILVYIIANLITLAIYNFFDPIGKELDIIVVGAIILIPLSLLSLFLHAYDFFVSLSESLRQKTHKN